LFYDDYQKQKNNLKAITAKITSLRNNGYDTAEIEDFFKLINETFYGGNLEKTKEFVERAKILLEVTEDIQQPLNLRIAGFIKLNRTFFIVLLILVPIILLMTARLLYVTRTETKIKELEKEKEEILRLMKALQVNYYSNHLIDKDLFTTYAESYRQRLGEIELSLIRLKFKQKHYFKKISKYEELAHEKAEIVTLIKVLQEEYYIKRLIDMESYEKLEQSYNSALTNIEAKLNALSKPADKTMLDSEVDVPYKEEISFSTEEGINEKQGLAENVKEPEVVFDTEIKAKKGRSGKHKTREIMSNKIPSQREPEKKKTEKTKEDLPTLEEKKLDPKEYFYLANGFVLKSIKELYHALLIMDDSLFEEHVNEKKNDFANWIKYVFGKELLAERISKVTTRRELVNLLK